MPLKTYDDFALATQYAFYKICENAGVKYDEKLNKDFKAILDGINEYKYSISPEAALEKAALLKDLASIRPSIRLSEKGFIDIADQSKIVTKTVESITKLSPDQTNRIDKQVADARFTENEIDKLKAGSAIIRADQEQAKTEGKTYSGGRLENITEINYLPLTREEMKEILNSKNESLVRNDIQQTDPQFRRAKLLQNNDIEQLEKKQYSEDLRFVDSIETRLKNSTAKLAQLFKDSPKLEQNQDTKYKIIELAENYINANVPEAAISLIGNKDLQYYPHQKYAEENKERLTNNFIQNKKLENLGAAIKKELRGIDEFVKNPDNFQALDIDKEDYRQLRGKLNQISSNLTDSNKLSESITNYANFCDELTEKIAKSTRPKLYRDFTAKTASTAGNIIKAALKFDNEKIRNISKEFKTQKAEFSIANKRLKKQNIDNTLNNLNGLNNALSKIIEKVPEITSSLNAVKTVQITKLYDAAQKEMVSERQGKVFQASQNNDLQHFINRTKDIAGITTQDLEKGVEQSAKMAPVSNKKSPLQNRLSQANASAGIPVKRTVVPRKSALASNIVTNKEKIVEKEPSQNVQQKSSLAANIISKQGVASSKTPPIGQRRPLPARKSLNKGQGQNPQAQASNAAAAEPLKPSNELAIKKPEGYKSQDRSNIPKSRLSQKQASQGGKQFGALRGSVGLSNNNLSPNVPKQEKQQTNWTIPQGQSARIDALWKKLQNRPETKFLTEGGKANPSSLQKELLLRNNLAQYKHDIRNASLVASNLPPMESKQFTTKSIAELKSMPKLPTKDTKAIEFAVKALDALDKVNTIDDPNKRNPYAKVDSYLKKIDNLDKPDLLEQATKLAKDKILQQASKLAQNILKSPATNQQQQNGKPGTATSIQQAIITAKNIGSDLTSKQANHVSPQPGANAIIPSHKPRGRGGR